MTQDYKDTLLRYLTGNLNIEDGDNEPQFPYLLSTQSAIRNYLQQNIGSANNLYIVDLLQGYQSNLSMLYGYSDYSGKGFIVILDQDMMPIQYIDSYSSGTAFGLFQKLNVADDGNVYGIDVNDGTPRFIMLNNITLKTPNQSEFVVKLRQSYNLPSPINTALTYFGVIKAVGQAKYIIGGTAGMTNGTKTMLTELTINVGSPNEWVDYEYEDTNYAFYGSDIFASWDDSGLTVLKANGYETEANDTTVRYYTEYYYDTVMQKRAYSFPETYTYDEQVKTIIVNDTTAYMGVLVLRGNSNPFYIYKVDYTNNELDLIETISYGNTQQGIGTIDYISFKKINGMAVFLVGQQFVQGTTDRLRYFVGYIIGEDVYYNYADSTSTNTFDKVLFLISNNYNLYTFGILGIDESIQYQSVYNDNNYNGVAYENTNSLVPNSCILYDTDGMLLFARNLYNVSIYGNTTLSTLQIPNTMVNDITVDTQDLMGKTNKILASNDDNFVKNIYETVYLNFYNSLVIQNRNMLPFTTNTTASELLNESVSRAIDYNDTQATIYRINYLDGTYQDNNILPTITNGVASYVMTVYVPLDNPIMNIQIRSADKIINYQQINGLITLTGGKIYTITQECYVE